MKAADLAISSIFLLVLSLCSRVLSKLSLIIINILCVSKLVHEGQNGERQRENWLKNEIRRNSLTA